MAKRKGSLFRLLLILVISVLGIWLGGTGALQLIAANRDYPPLNIGEASAVYANDGKTVLGHIQPAKKGQTLKDEQVSSLVRQAHMAAEDRSYHEHGALSAWGIAWAVITNVRQGSMTAAGGSTITQQYVKNAYLSKEKELDRKIPEAIFSYKLESDYTKDQILTMYVNNNFYGRGYGIQDASLAWFGRPATELNNPKDPLQVAQAAFLASLLKKPSKYAKYVGNNPADLVLKDELKQRVEYTLDGLREVKGIDPRDRVSDESIKQAKALLPLKVTGTPNATGTSKDTDPYLLSYIKDWLSATQTEAIKQTNEGISDEEAANQGQKTVEELLARGGLKIYTSIDPKVQNLVKEAVDSKLPKRGLSAGVVILDPRTGAVAAMYGGADYAKDGNNYALYANRQVGSTMKAVVLADAVRKGISPKSVFAAPAYIEINGSKIYNNDKKPALDCRLSLEDAIAYSNNPVHIELITGKMADCGNPSKLSNIPNHPVSPASVAELARKMGAEDSMVPGKTSPSQLDEVPTLALGTSSLTPLKMASIGATLANDGIHTKPHVIEKIVMSDDSPAYENTVVAERALEAKHVQVVNQVLTGVYSKGTASKARLDRPAAGKTGTTDTDAWMLAFSAIDPKNASTPAYVCSVWAGFPDNRPIAPSSLSSLHTAQVCQHILTGALKGSPKVDFPPADLGAGRRIGLK